METFLILIPVTLALVALSLWAFVWSARKGQFEDIDRQAWSMLFDNTEEKQTAGRETRQQEAPPDSAPGAPQDDGEHDGRAP